MSRTLEPEAARDERVAQLVREHRCEEEERDAGADDPVRAPAPSRDSRRQLAGGQRVGDEQRDHEPGGVQRRSGRRRCVRCESTAPMAASVAEPQGLGRARLSWSRRASQCRQQPRSARSRAPARSDVSNQNGSGKRRIRFESGPNCHVPAWKKSAWNGGEGGLEVDARRRCRATSAATPTASAAAEQEPRHGEPALPRSSHPVRTQKHNGDDARVQPGPGPAPPTSRMWLRSDGIQDRGSPDPGWPRSRRR